VELARLLDRRVLVRSTAVTSLLRQVA
jgi:hypothetical protein